MILAPGNLCIGLTGGIGSGKSTVARLFAECDAAIIDSDEISHRLTQSGGRAIEEIRSSFGAEFIDANGAMNRVRMRQLIFSNAIAKKQLEGILHPLICSQMFAQAEEYAGIAPYALLVIPLLFESGNYVEKLQRTLVVDCSEATQIRRTMQRSGLEKEEVSSIIAQQIPRAERLRRADDVIQNDADLAPLKQQVLHLHSRYLDLSSGTD